MAKYLHNSMVTFGYLFFKTWQFSISKIFRFYPKSCLAINFIKYSNRISFHLINMWPLVVLLHTLSCLSKLGSLHPWFTSMIGGCSKRRSIKIAKSWLSMAATDALVSVTPEQLWLQCSTSYIFQMQIQILYFQSWYHYELMQFS